jgi:hypothetical protein
VLYQKNKRFIVHNFSLVHSYRCYKTRKTTMKRILFIVIALNTVNHIACDAFSSTLGHIKPKATSEVQADAVQDLITRIITYK